MTHEEALKKLETDIQLRGMSTHTLDEYRSRVTKFLRYFENKPIDELSENDFRIYLEYLSREGKLQPSSINNNNSALRFFFEVTLEQTLCYRRVPRKKDPIKLPTAFNQEEILQLFHVIDDSTRYKAIFALTYGCGLRLSEIRHLRIKDIDKKQMRLFIYQGKGQRDRWIPLSKFAYDDLCTYWREYKPNHPDGYLFLNGRNGIGDAPISERAIQDAFKKYHSKANIPTYGTVHTLRHSYATHLLEDGVNVFYIQRLLGHATLWTTMRYLRISMTDIMKTKSPFDKLMELENTRHPMGIL